jgi:hypothetical protein
MLDGKNKPYSELGKLLDGLARSRDVRGPYNIANYVENVTGHAVSGQAVSKYLYGKYLPKRAFINAFADAFELIPRERSELAWAYTYGFRPEDKRSIAEGREESVNIPTGHLLGQRSWVRQPSE